ncbi:MAG: amidohydrolase family protein [Desulfobacterales bacterium]|jgi:N-acyl-D-aspartate/D-glutamate deacylase
MFDLLIQNARICDGTDKPAWIGTLGVEGDRITYIGQESGQAAQRKIDADGLVLAPGFIDPHTHYDAQVAWDPLLTCSPWHGVTTVVMGNCGVGVAPVKPESRDILLYDLVNIEDLSFDVMNAGVDWQWESFGEYLNVIDQGGLGINVAGLVAFTPLRHYVMGEAAFERQATPEEIEKMHRLMQEAMGQGAFGFSTSYMFRHLGYQGRPLACRNASKEELIGLCRALRNTGRGAIQIVLNSGGYSLIKDEDVDLLSLLTNESGRPVTWLALFARTGEPDFHKKTIDKMSLLLDRAIPQVTPRPMLLQDTLQNPFEFASLDCWQPAINRSVEEQISLYKQADFRAAFLEDLEGDERDEVWERIRVQDVTHPDLEHYRNRTIMEIADAEGKKPLDVYLDIGIADNLSTRFQVQAFNYDMDGVERLVTEDKFMIGLGDGGAHVQMLCDAGYATALLEIWVRQRKALTLEKAVQKLTSVPATLYGIPERGFLAPGKVADLVLFDPEKVSSKIPEYVSDFPLNSRRLVAKAEGIVATFVAGKQLYDNGTHTGAMPGRVLRSYEQK